jgi:Uma2 family endonuclease
MSFAVVEKLESYEEDRRKPMPSFNHAIVQANLIGQLIHQRDFRVASELTLEFEGQKYTPDIVVYPWRPVDFRHDDIVRNDPPLLAIEIFSPTQGAQEILDKTEIYFRNGVKSCWIVSPAFRTITVLKPDGSQEIYDSGKVTDPATGITIDLDAVFS